MYSFTGFQELLDSKITKTNMEDNEETVLAFGKSMQQTDNSGCRVIRYKRRHLHLDGGSEVDKKPLMLKIGCSDRCERCQTNQIGVQL